MTNAQRTCWLLTLFLLSACGLAYQILLIDLIRIIQWSHFSYMIISLALLGFGASGTYLSLAKRKIKTQASSHFFMNAILFSITMVGCFLISQAIPFNALNLIWNINQSFYLVLSYITLSIPFFFLANTIGISFFQFHDRINTVYAIDLMGAALGCITAVFALYYLLPLTLLIAICGVTLITTFIISVSLTKTIRSKIISVLVIMLLTILFFTPLYQLKPFAFKPLSITLNTPKTKIIHQQSNPLGLVSVVRSPQIPFHYAPGLSLYNHTNIAPQLGVFTNYDNQQVITHFNGDFKLIQYLDYMTNALAYHLLDQPHVLIINGGTGNTALLALYHHAKHIDQTELNPIYMHLIQNTFAHYSGYLYSHHYPIKLFNTQARVYLMQSKQKYNLIELPLVDSSASQSSSTYGIENSYLYTVESLQLMLKHLESDGMISITQWLKLPPRNSLKLIVTAMKSLNTQQPEQHLALIRGWKTFTLLIKKTPFTIQNIAQINAFCQARGFDLAYYPGMQKHEANQFNILNHAQFYHSITQLLKNPQHFIKNYPFNITPTTDNRPFFFDFFKWGALSETWPLRLHAHGLVDWGYLLNIFTLAQAMILSIILIVLPIIILKKQAFRQQQTLVTTLVFLCIGFAYLLTEINYIQRFTLFFSNPVLAVAIITAIFLGSSGVGSLLTRPLVLKTQHASRYFSSVIVLIILINIIYCLCLSSFLQYILSLNAGLRWLCSLAPIVPLAFLMGIPFPYCLNKLSKNNHGNIAIAWAANGCASVIASIGSGIIALSFGLNAVLLLAAGLYLLAYLIFSITAE